MTSPIIVDLPHSLGQAEARRRIEKGLGRIGDHMPGGSAHVESHWSGDSLHLKVTAMGQHVSARIDALEKMVRVEVALPGALSFFAKPVEALLRNRGGALLEDKSGGKGGA
jgi:hypothetical protein